MTAKRARVLALIGLTALVGCIYQSAPKPTTPQYWRIRLHAVTIGGADTTMLSGIVVWASEDSLRIYGEQTESYLTLPVARIVTIEIYRGQRATAGTAAKGAAAGAGVGAFLGAVSSGAAAAVFGAIWDSEVDVERAIVYGAVEGAVDGAAVGLVAGATLGEASWQVIGYDDLREEMCHCQLPVRSGSE